MRTHVFITKVSSYITLSEQTKISVDIVAVYNMIFFLEDHKLTYLFMTSICVQILLHIKHPICIVRLVSFAFQPVI